MTTNEQVQMRTCPLCEGMCGIEVRVQDGQVLSVRPDRDNVFSRGHMCPKGTTMGALHHDPDRLRGPVIKKKDRKSVVQGKSVSVRVDLGGRRIIKKKNERISMISIMIR